MKRLIKWLILCVLFVSILISGKITYDGYQLYKETMSNVDIEMVIDDVRSQETYVSINDMPNHLLHAIIAVEDHRFMKHDGFDIISFGRAVLRNIKENEFAAGGSTITQQLAKNLFFSFEKRLERKVAELIVAKEIEDLFSKEEILELYINIIYYGDGYENIHDAAKGYFDKMPKALTDAECTLLAGLPQAPSSYALFENFDRAVERSYEVIDAMVIHHYLTNSEAEALKKEVKNVKLQVK